MVACGGWTAPVLDMPSAVAPVPGVTAAGGDAVGGSSGEGSDKKAGTGAGKPKHQLPGYDGEVLVEGNAPPVRHGHGVQVFSNKSFTYSGEWRRGVMEGSGVLSICDGGSYEGEFRAGEMEGQGLRRWASGASYSGEFHMGEAHGEGVHIAANGDKYEGAWVAGLRSGQGEMHRIEGSAYGGSDGGVYCGPFHNNVEHGEGRSESGSGDTYEGEFQAGFRHGKGTMHWACGDRYVGDWASGNRHGNGRFFHAQSGIIWDGRWDADTAARSCVRLELRVPPPQEESTDEKGEGDAAEGDDAEEKVSLEQQFRDIVGSGVKRGESLPHFQIVAVASDGSVCSEENGRLVTLRLARKIMPDDEEGEVRFEGARLEAFSEEGDSEQSVQKEAFPPTFVRNFKLEAGVADAKSLYQPLDALEGPHILECASSATGFGAAEPARIEFVST